MTARRIGRRTTVTTIWALSILLALGLGWWAAAQATRPPTVGTPETATVTTEVTHGKLGVEQGYGIDVAWPTHPVGVNGTNGTLTSLDVAAAGTRIGPGDILYTVDLTPVIAAEGAIPAFRDLTAGTTGQDVRQLQEFLAAAGYLATAPDGKYGPATTAAVKIWSKELGVQQDGSVPLGRIAFIPKLPADLAPAKDLRVGARVTTGQELLAGALSSPVFSFRVLPEVVSRTTPGLQVRIDADGTPWRAEVERLATATDGTDATIAVLRPVSGEKSICGPGCSTALSLGATSVLPGKLVLVPEISGPLVPTAAILTDAAGFTYLATEDGKHHPITIKASHEGRSIVEGVEPGQRITVAGDPGRQ